MAPDVRATCPTCGGAVHPIASRCKHCRADLTALRGGHPAATAMLPALLAGAGGSRPPPVGPARPTGAVDAPVARSRWIAITLAVSGLAITLAVAAIAWPHGAVAPVAPASPASMIVAAPRVIAPDAPAAKPQVRPPLAGDLASYTTGLAGTGKLHATIVTTLGTIHCTLFEDTAPMTVANFVGLATGKKPWSNPKTGAVETDRPFYDGLIQGGDPIGTGTGGPGYQFGDEIVPGLKMEPGTLAMANAGPVSNGSQFFITEGAPSWLDGRHTIFGKCSDLEVIRAIARAAQDASNRPLAPIRMTVTISR
jgi:cyclophilin family peptidyl-prolyl cis-trans isomerase